jgi:hypothetical protein
MESRILSVLHRFSFHMKYVWMKILCRPTAYIFHKYQYFVFTTEITRYEFMLHSQVCATLLLF